MNNKRKYTQLKFVFEKFYKCKCCQKENTEDFMVGFLEAGSILAICKNCQKKHMQGKASGLPSGIFSFLPFDFYKINI